jgi:hypothetical protein
MSFKDARRALEERFGNCPECGAPWRRHWNYKREGGQLFRRYNTCALMPSEIMSKWNRRAS